MADLRSTETEIAIMKTEEKKPVKFSGVSDKNGYFSNFASFPVTIDGKTWPTVEHYVQARQFKNGEYDEEILKYRSASIVVRMSREREGARRADWDKVKDKVMRKAVKAKFSQHENLRERLLATGDQPIVQNTPNNDYWGDGGDGSGQNRMGKILMEIRTQMAKDHPDVVKRLRK